MTDLRIQFSEEMVGAGHPAKADTLNRLALVEHNNDGTHSKATQIKDPWVDVRAYGAVADGVTDCWTAVTSAISYAQANGIGTVLLPSGVIKMVSPNGDGITLDGVWLIGQGWNTNLAASTVLKFYNLTSTSGAAIKTRQPTGLNRVKGLRNLAVLASSWDATAGCLGYGLDIESVCHIDNVYVGNFKKSNVFFHHDSNQNGPYQSLIVNLYSAYSGQHGVLVGAGANTITFINLRAFWNGAPSYGTAPSVAGNYDGFYVTNGNDGQGYPTYTPEALTIIGGDCSYNSRYGWNLETFSHSANVCPNYGEGNLVKEVRTGNFFKSCVRIGAISSTADWENAADYGAYYYLNSVYIGGKRVHPPNFYEFISNQTAEDLVGSTISNAPVDKKIFLTRSNDQNHLTYFSANTTPDGYAVNPATETVATLMGLGTWALGIGHGSRFLKVTENGVRLPDRYYQATSTGWSASSVIRDIGTAAPVSGTWSQGDRRDNLTPNEFGTAGSKYVVTGWICAAPGTPGTWLEMRALTGN